MRRSMLALAIGLAGLTLSAGPASAQQIDDTLGGVQVGEVAVEAPVRVLSDGDNQSTQTAPQPSAQGEQTTTDSAGTAQVTSATVHAPVRVASDGDDQAPSSSSSPEQESDDSTGAVQAGSVRAHAPVRALSDGDNAGAASSGAAGTQSSTDSTASVQAAAVDACAPVRVGSDGDGGCGAESSSGESTAVQSSDDSLGAVQLGGLAVAAPIRVLSDGENRATVRTASENPSTTTASSGGGGTTPLTEATPVTVPFAGNDGQSEPSRPDSPVAANNGNPALLGSEGANRGGGGTSVARTTASRTLSDRQLPFTGSELWPVVLLGALLALTGLALRRSWKLGLGLA